MVTGRKLYETLSEMSALTKVERQGNDGAALLFEQNQVCIATGKGKEPQEALEKLQLEQLTINDMLAMIQDAPDLEEFYDKECFSTLHDLASTP